MTWAFRVFFFLYAGFICYVSLIPVELLPLQFDIWDKVQHLTTYGFLALLAYAGWPGKPMWIHFAVVSGLGITLEFLQGATGYRHFEVADMVANSLGAALAWGICSFAMGVSGEEGEA